MGLLHRLLVGLPIVGGLAISAVLFPSVALWFWESTAPASIDTSILRGIQLLMLYLVFGAVLLSPVLGGVGLGILVSRRHW